MEIKDGVSLYRNPVQTMDKLKSLIPGLRNEDALDKFWEGSIHDTKRWYAACLSSKLNG